MNGFDLLAGVMILGLISAQATMILLVGSVGWRGILVAVVGPARRISGAVPASYGWRALGVLLLALAGGIYTAVALTDLDPSGSRWVSAACAAPMCLALYELTVGLRRDYFLPNGGRKGDSQAPAPAREPTLDRLTLLFGVATYLLSTSIRSPLLEISDSAFDLMLLAFLLTWMFHVFGFALFVYFIVNSVVQRFCQRPGRDIRRLRRASGNGCRRPRRSKGATPLRGFLQKRRPGSLAPEPLGFRL
jgi:hypothetical protein